MPLSNRGDDQVLVTVLVPRVDGESVPVTIDANGVTITRNGTVITTPLPFPADPSQARVARLLSRRPFSRGRP